MSINCVLAWKFPAQFRTARCSCSILSPSNIVGCFWKTQFPWLSMIKCRDGSWTGMLVYYDFKGVAGTEHFYIWHPVGPSVNGVNSLIFLQHICNKKNALWRTEAINFYFREAVLRPAVEAASGHRHMTGPSTTYICDVIPRKYTRLSVG